MHLIDNHHITDPAVNLALEEYTFKHRPPGGLYLLFYVNAPTVVVGKHQNLFLEVDHEYVTERGMHLMRRISGGGTVYHDPGNLNFSFITDFREHNLSHLPELLNPIVECLNRLGVPARRNDKNDIVVNGNKVTGTAQHTDMKSVIHHGTLLFDADLDPLRRSLKSNLEILYSKGVASVRSPVANIASFLRHPMTMARFREAITHSLAAAFGHIRPYDLGTDQWREIEALAETKYRSWAWRYGRNPEFGVRHRMVLPTGEHTVDITVQNGRIHQVTVVSREGEEAVTPGSDGGHECLRTGEPYDPVRVRRLCKDNGADKGLHPSAKLA